MSNEPPIPNTFTDRLAGALSATLVSLQTVLEAECKNGHRRKRGVISSAEAALAEYRTARANATPDSSPADCREAFEKWARQFEYKYTLTRRSDGLYESSHTHIMWEAFQAAWGARDIPTPDSDVDNALIAKLCALKMNRGLTLLASATIDDCIAVIRQHQADSTQSSRESPVEIAAKEIHSKVKKLVWAWNRGEQNVLLADVLQLIESYMGNGVREGVREYGRVFGSPPKMPFVYGNVNIQSVTGDVKSDVHRRAVGSIPTSPLQPQESSTLGGAGPESADARPDASEVRGSAARTMEETSPASDQTHFISRMVAGFPAGDSKEHAVPRVPEPVSGDGWLIPLDSMSTLAQESFVKMMSIISGGGQVRYYVASTPTIFLGG